MSGLVELNVFRREYISDATRQLVCFFAAGDVTRPLPVVEADWDDVFYAICRNGLVGLTVRYLRAQASRDYPPRGFRQSLNQAYLLSSLNLATLYRRMGVVLGPLVDAGVDCMVLKGPAVGQLIYPDPA